MGSFSVKLFNMYPEEQQEKDKNKSMKKYVEL